MILTICGNHKSGKSLYAASLANGILHKTPKASIIMINLSKDIPAHAMWEPSRVISNMNSVGFLFEEGIITVKSVPKFTITHKSNDNIGLIGYCIGDTPITFNEPTYDNVIELIKVADQLADYVILDCDSNMLSDFLAASIEMADDLSFLVTPDIDGTLYLQTFKKMYESNMKYAQVIANMNYILSPVKTFNGSEAFVEQIKNGIESKNNLILEVPYNIEVDVAMGEGKIFDIYKSSPSKYKKVVDKHIKNIRKE